MWFSVYETDWEQRVDILNLFFSPKSGTDGDKVTLLLAIEADSFLSVTSSSSGVTIGTLG